MYSILLGLLTLFAYFHIPHLVQLHHSFINMQIMHFDVCYWPRSDENKSGYAVDCGGQFCWHSVWRSAVTRSAATGRCIYTHPFNSSLSGTTRVSWYQKGKTNLHFTEARDSEWQWNLLGHMQVCTSLQTDNHASTPPLNFYRPDALPVAQPTVSKH